MAILWRGIGGAERVGRGRGRVWGKRQSSLVNLLVQPTGKNIADDLAKAFFLDQATASSAALTGASSLTFGASESLQGNGPLVGASTLTFTPGGDLTGTDAATAITGATSFAFAPSGAMTGTSVATGSTSVAFATAGALAGGAVATGATNLMFATSGIMGSGAALTGAANLTFAPTGGITGGGALGGAGTVTFTPSGDLITGATITASTSFAFTTGGILNGAALIGGSSFPTFTLSGGMATGAAATGATAYQFTPAGDITGANAETAPSRSGGWLPVIYLDKDGNNVDLSQAVEIAAKAVPKSERAEVKQVAASVAPLVDGAFISAQISADLAKLTAILDRVDADLADAIRRDIITAKQAAIEEDIALILLLAS